MGTLLRRSGRRRRRGIALLLVLVVLLLVSTLAVEIALTARTHHQLSSHAMNDFLLRSVVDGRRHILLAALRHDQTRGDNLDTEEDRWGWVNSSKLSSWGDAGGTPTEAADPNAKGDGALAYRNRDVEIVAWCEDERGKLNLRGLVWEEDSPTFITTRRTLERLIDVYRESWPELDVSDSDARSMVDDLVEWVGERSKEDTDENPLPPTHARQGRLLSLEDLFRVPGGKWRPELLYDVRDPRETEEDDWSRRVSGPAEPIDDEASSDPADSRYERANGVPGLLRYLTVWGEGTAGSVPRINVNTAAPPVIEALFDPGQEDLADALVDHRRQGGNPEEAPASGSSGDASAGGWFKAKTDLTKVEGMGDDLGRYPRLDTMAEFKSAVFSLRIVASVVSAQVEGDEEEGIEGRDVEATYQYREVVQRTQQGFVSIHAERRYDPALGANRP